MPTYIDHLGHETAYDGEGELAWRVSIYVIAIRDNTILLLEPAWATRWELPGGAVEPGLQETLGEGAVRECWEETGYTFLPNAAPELVSESFFFQRSHNRYCHSLIFTMTGVTENTPDSAWRPDPAEITRVAWVPLAELTPDAVYAPHWHALQRLNLVA